MISLAFCPNPNNFPRLRAREIHEDLDKTRVKLFPNFTRQLITHTNFRIGNHNLKIETGRFTIPKTPEDLRICDHCNQNSVENELHILIFLGCDQYNDLRKTLF